MMAGLRAILTSVAIWAVGWLLLIFWTLTFLLLSVFIHPRRLYGVLRMACRSILAAAGMRIRLSGREHLDVQPCVYMANHVNILDQFVFGAVIPRPVIGLEAAEHFGWPVYGWVISRWGNLPISRWGNLEMNERSLSKAVEYLQGGGSVAIMPEGTRTRDGKLGRFHPGGFRLAIQAQVPIVVLVQRGSFALNRKGSWSIRPGNIEVQVCPPVYPEGDSDQALETLMKRVRALIEEGLAVGMEDAI